MLLRMIFFLVGVENDLIACLDTKEEGRVIPSKAQRAFRILGH